MYKVKIMLLFILYVWQAQAQTINITGPAGSGQFGSTVTVLTNGNYVVTDPLYDDGAIADVGVVYLYNGSTHALISTLKGSTVNDNIGSAGPYASSIIILNNGNYLVLSPYWDNGAATDAGAVTWCNANTGVSGVVGSSNSLVGNTTDDRIGNGGITMLSNGNYLVNNPNWDNGIATDAGAVTWGSAASGVSGTVGSSNSLVGSSTGDFSNYTLTILNNGNYVVLNKYWDNGVATDAGSVTWANGSVGVSGVISSGNSLVGNATGDQVGYDVTRLNNNNFVVYSPGWDNGAIANAGAVTWVNGNVGLLGAISSSNSLVGNSINDSVGWRGITALSNGNYVVCSPRWDNGAVVNVGAATWANGITGITGTISNSNSLVGSTANDYAAGSVTALTNGNYVVCSPGWHNGAVVNVGAATWGNGITGIMGTISNSNSLVGSAANDNVGGSVTALTNGNYVVSSLGWTNGTAGSAGAVTWGDGTVGIAGVVSIVNSLVGSKSSDAVGSGGITNLNNGNYLVRSPVRDGSFVDEGAVTWGNGNTGVSGTISSSNSLVGGQPNYRVGDIVTVLTNSNYVVTIPRWSYGAHYAGAVFWCNGATGVSGGALVGSTLFDGVGNQVYPLSNGNYVVVSLYWDNGTAIDAGAVTFGNGTTGVSGAISSSNSLVGTTSYDRVGTGGIKELGNGNYVVLSPGWSNYWNYSGYYTAGAVTWGNGLTGIQGLVNSSNSLIGSTTDDRVGNGGITVLSNGNYYVVRSPSWDNGVVTDAGAITLGNNAGGVAGFITSCNSFKGSTAGGGSSLNFAFNDFYDYLVVGRPLDNIVSIYRPTNQTLSNSLDTVSVNISGNSAIPLITNTGCRIITTISPSIPLGFLNGVVNAKAWVEDTIPTQSSNPFVARHYEITPVTNPAFSVGKITLYFSQQEFDDFNAHAASTLDLPTGDGDAVGKANLRIGKYPGTSSNGTGLPGTYSGIPQVIDPIDADIVWNSILNRWEVSFDVMGFSGFIVQTSQNVLPLTLLEFKGRLVNNNAVLNWKTTDEVNTLSFDIERSTDGISYSTIGNVAAINQPGIHQYGYTDNNIISLGAPVVYYRLKQKDIDGGFRYSGIIALSIDNSRSFVQFYPNPTGNDANLIITVNEPVQLQGRIIDNTGRTVKQLQVNTGSGSASLTIDLSGLAKGLYFLELKGKHINENIRFLKL